MSVTPTEVEAVADALTLHAIQIRRFDTQEIRKVTAFLGQMEARIAALLLAENAKVTVDAWSVARLEAIRLEVRTLIEASYTQLYNILARDLSPLGPYEARFQQAMFERILGVSIQVPVGEQLLALATQAPFDGMLLGEHVSNMAANYFRVFNDTVSQGIALGEPMPSIIDGAIGLTSTPGSVARHNAAAIVRTSVANTTNVARTETYKMNDDLVDGEEWSATLDDRTTEVCGWNDTAIRRWDEETWSNGYQGEYPAHYNERSQILPLFTGSSGSGGQSYEEWLSKQSEEKQNEILGEVKAQAWRDGKVTLGGFTDPYGKPLTLEELELSEGMAA
jgi:hypothetical protein